MKTKGKERNRHCGMLKQRVDEIIRKQCKEEDKERESFEGLDLINDLELDSVALMQIIVDVEEEFGIEIDIEEYGIEIFSEYNHLFEFLKERV